MSLNRSPLRALVLLWFSRVRALFRRDELDREMTEEMRAHIEEQVQCNLQAGMNPDEARLAARRQFGGLTQIQERARDVIRWNWLDGFTRDVRHGFRVLRNEKWLGLLAIVVLALGTAGVTTVFTIINGTLIQLLPFPEPDELMTLKLRDPKLGANRAPNSNILESDYRVFAGTLRSFEQLASYVTFASTVSMNNVGVSAEYAHVEPGIFDLLGVKPIRGRGFQTDNESSALISYDLWQRQFGGRPDILEQFINFGGRRMAIIGVMPAGFRFLRSDDFWVPRYALVPRFPRGQERYGVSVLGRLKPGVSLESARAELSLLAGQLAEEYPATNAQRTWSEIVPLADDLVGPQYRRALMALAVAVGLVLLIACVNVMNLQFARASRRVQEVGIRIALGASPRQVVRQLLIESAIIAIAGSLVGVVLSFWAGQLLHGVFTSPAGTSQAPPTWANFNFDFNVLFVVLAITGATIMISGLAPALLMARVGVAGALKQSRQSTASGRIERVTRAFVVAQIALTVPVLLGSLLLARSLFNGLQYDFGAEVVRELVTARFPPQASPPTRLNFFGAVTGTVAERPEFEHVALTTRVPTMAPDIRMFTQYEVDGEIYQSEASRPTAITEMISGSYFETIGVGLLQGRTITADDIAKNAPVAVVNTVFAARHFGGSSPIGQRYRTIDPTNNRPGPWRTIVGIVPSFGGQWPAAVMELDPPLAFEPLQAITGPVTLVARGRVPPEALVKPLNDALTGRYPGMSLSMVGSVPGHLRDRLREKRTTTMMTVAFGGLAVFLATIGLYGVAAYSVSQRTREFGIRLALGAATAQIMRTVLQRGALQFVIGTTIGAMVALTLTAMSYQRIVEFLYQVSPLDLPIYAVVGVILAAVTSLACWLPARRAAKVDPVIALRAE